MRGSGGMVSFEVRGSREDARRVADSTRLFRLASGFGANWITDWYSYDAEATAILGLSEGERVAGFVLIGTPREPPLERERPDLAPLVTHLSTGETSLHVSGVRVSGPDGVQGHSVIVYTGDRVTDAVSGVANNRVACGTFTPVQPFAF